MFDHERYLPDFLAKSVIEQSCESFERRLDSSFLASIDPDHRDIVSKHVSTDNSERSASPKPTIDHIEDPVAKVSAFIRSVSHRVDATI
jgi:hypothetical protein